MHFCKRKYVCMYCRGMYVLQHIHKLKGLVGIHTYIHKYIHTISDDIIFFFNTYIHTYDMNFFSVHTYSTYSSYIHVSENRSWCPPLWPSLESSSNTHASSHLPGQVITHFRYVCMYVCMYVPSSSLAPSTSQLSEVDSKEFFLFTWKCTLMLGLGLDGYMGDVPALSPLPLRAT